MPQMVVTANADERESVWHIDTSNGQNAAQIWLVRNLSIEWADGTIEVLPKRIRALTNPGSSPQVDITSLDYYIVVYRGGIAASVPPSIVPVTALDTLDTLYTGKDWGLLRVFGKWGSRDPLVGGGSGGSGMPDPILGAILRGNLIDGTLAWEVYPPGDTGEVLTMSGGLPVWAPSQGAAGTPPTIVSTITNTVCLDLYDAGTHTNHGEPPGWQNVGFDDSAWSAPVAANVILAGGGGAGPVPGSTALWPTLHPNPDGDSNGKTMIALFRAHVNITATSFSTATLRFFADSAVTVWVNGTNVGSVNFYVDGPAIKTVSVNPTLFVIGDNVIAFEGQDINPIPISPPLDAAWVSFSFTLS